MPSWLTNISTTWDVFFSSLHNRYQTRFTDIFPSLSLTDVWKKSTNIRGRLCTLGPAYNPLTERVPTYNELFLLHLFIRCKRDPVQYHVKTCCIRCGSNRFYVSHSLRNMSVNWVDCWVCFGFFVNSAWGCSRKHFPGLSTCVFLGARASAAIIRIEKQQGIDKKAKSEK